MADKNSDGTVKLSVKETKPVKRAVADVAAPKSKVVKGAVDVAVGETLKKPQFLDNAVARSGVKRRDAKPAIEAALNELGEALMRGDEINLPPLGKIKVIKTKALSEGAHALTLKLRTMKTSAADGKTGVARSGEDS